MHAKMTPMNDEGENKKPSSSSNSSQKRAKSEENQKKINFLQHMIDKGHRRLFNKSVGW